MSTLGTNYTAPRWIGKPLTHITPMSLSDGATFERKLDWVYNYLVNTLVPELDGILDQWFDQYKDDHAAQLADIQNTKNEWQALFDQFMADVVAQLEALNDQAVANLIRNTTTATGALVEKLFLDDKDLTHPYKSSEFYGITDRVSLEAAIASAPAGSRIALPRDLEIAIGSTPINIGRAVHISGGVFTANDKAFYITGDGVGLSDMSITGVGSHNPYKPNHAAIEIRGDIDAYVKVDLENVTITDQVDTGVKAAYIQDSTFKNVVVDRFRYSGIALLSASNVTVTHSTVQHCNQDDSVGLSYGMYASDGVNLPEHRSRNVTFSFNTIHDIPGWEGMDTHGGLNIRFLFNQITKVRNAIVLGVGSYIRKTAPQGCQVIGNYIDGMSATPLAPENGILIGGSSSDNVNGALYADAIIVNNTILNVTVKTNVINVMSIDPGVQSQRIDYEKTIVANNGGDVREPWREGTRAYEETAYDTGWVEATQWGSYAPGYARNSQWPLEFRVVGDHRGRDVYLRGSLSISSTNPPPDNKIFRITHSALKPAHPVDNSVVVGTIMRNSNDGGTFVATFRTDDYIAHQFPTTPLLASDGYISMALNWRV